MTFGVGGEVALAQVIHDTDVTNGCAGRPQPLLGSGRQTLTGTLRSQLVVELGEGCQHILHELPGWVRAYGLGDGANLNPKAVQFGPQTLIIERKSMKCFPSIEERMRTEAAIEP